MQRRLKYNLPINNRQEAFPALNGTPFLLRRMISDYVSYRYSRNVKRKPRNIIIIGASTGGTRAVETILKGLPANLPAVVVIAQHVPAGFSETLLQRLSKSSTLPVELGKSGMALTSGKVILAPGGRNMIVKAMMGNINRLVIDFSEEAAPSSDMPSADLLMQTAAKYFGHRSIGVILSGMGNDGTAGAKIIHENKGHVVVQDQRTSAVFGMGRSVIAQGYAHSVLPVDYISFHLQGKVLSRYTHTVN